MKFCKNLQRVVDISDPEWAPYWTNYKMLKKLIKELPSLVPADESKAALPLKSTNGKILSDSPLDSMNIHTAVSDSDIYQNHGDKIKEHNNKAVSTRQVSASFSSAGSQCSVDRVPTSASASASASNDKTINSNEISTGSSSSSTHRTQHQHQPQDAESIGKSPGEVAFFKLLHSEFKKASHFFDRATEEFTIREERVREGMDIMRQPNSIMVNEKWVLMAKSIYRLYKDLLLLETFAIMTYCSFSKILKKHDKVTGYETRNAFMSNIVNKANFTHYPNVLSMITRCERFYEEVSANLLREGKGGLYEDERLFINMIHRLNEQVLDSSDSAKTDKTVQAESSSSSATATQRRTACAEVERTISVPDDRLSPATSKLRNLVEENAKQNNFVKMNPSSSNVNEGGEGAASEYANNVEDREDDDSDTDGAWRGQRATKRTKVS